MPSVPLSKPSIGPAVQGVSVGVAVLVAVLVRVAVGGVPVTVGVGVPWTIGTFRS